MNNLSVKERLLSQFQGMSSKESMDYQLLNWRYGISLHNPVRDECCPDFSCCNEGILMSSEVREKFCIAVKEKDEEAQCSILSMALSSLSIQMNLPIYIAGENHDEH